MPCRRAALPLVLSLVLALAAGCGTDADSAGDFEGAEAQVAQAVEDLQEAAFEGEERRICRQLLSAELARRAGDCNRAVAAAIDDADTAELEVEDVTIDGDRATARVTVGRQEEQTETFALVREGGAWRFAEFGGATR
jgi:hypothetical protein